MASSTSTGTTSLPTGGMPGTNDGAVMWIEPGRASSSCASAWKAAGSVFSSASETTSGAGCSDAGTRTR
jgi:hypothetical protein